MSTNPRGSAFKVAGDVPDLFLADGDFVFLRADGTPLCVVRKLDTERFGLDVALHALDAITGPAEPSAVDLLRGIVGDE